MCLNYKFKLIKSIFYLKPNTQKWENHLSGELLWIFKDYSTFEDMVDRKEIGQIKTIIKVIDFQHIRLWF